jgi:hypothetical protein
MKVLQELTEWAVEHDMKNHIYFTNDSKDKMYAYIKHGTVDVFKFKVPIKFSTSRRKFKEVPNTFGYDYKEDRAQGRTWQVSGSRGDSYTVTEENGTWMCTCAGFKFRGECRHIKEVGQK